jgi:pentatricopeptide repeat protein
MLLEYSIKGTPEVYTIALRSCSLTGDLGFALKIYDDMNKIGVQPDEVLFLSGNIKGCKCSLSYSLFDFSLLLNAIYYRCF